MSTSSKDAKTRQSSGNASSPQGQTHYMANEQYNAPGAAPGSRESGGRNNDAPYTVPNGIFLSLPTSNTPQKSQTPVHYAEDDDNIQITVINPSRATTPYPNSPDPNHDLASTMNFYWHPHNKVSSGGDVLSEMKNLQIDPKPQNN